jgi:poly[(R)-3-hydroxyalkanoate] polymerase subunit PhaC
MSVEATEFDALTVIRREIERNALRARNGLKYLTGARFVRSGTTPRDLVWQQGKSQLWRYRSDRVTRHPPIVVYVGLVGRSYVFDLYPANSFVQKLMDQGFDVFVIDWGVPDEVEARNTIATYTLELLPRAIDAVLESSGEHEVTILGYCMGGCLTVASLGAGTGIPVKSLILAATPTDFSKMGEFFEPLRSGSFDPETAIDETGNVPASLVRASFRVRKPTSDLVVYANLWQNLWNDQYMEGFQAMNEWVNDQVPFPGAAFREFLSEWLIGNGLVNGTLHIGGRRVDLGRIRCPVLCVIAEKDDIVPIAAAEPLPALLKNAQVQMVKLPAGHINLVTGRLADQVTIPSIVSFVNRHAETRAA